jgi:DeoR family transcriptional regulator of aga operon
MNIADRHKFILDKVLKEGTVSVVELSDELQVSAVTIRKDLKFLEERKLLFRTHGSASHIDPYVNDRPVNVKESIQVDEKRRIAAKAVELIAPDDSIIIGSGTTVLEVARAIDPSIRLTVLTAAMNITQALQGHKEVEIVQLGGVVRKSSSSVVGPYAESMLKDFACSKLFLGVDGIDADFGLTTTNMLEAHLNQVMMKAAHKTVVVADSSKFGRKGFGKICELDMVDMIITDSGLNPAMAKKIEELGVKLIIA